MAISTQIDLQKKLANMGDYTSLAQGFDKN